MVRYRNLPGSELRGSASAILVAGATGVGVFRYRC